MAHGRDVTREPCPDRIVEDLGGAFGMGCVGGFLWHFGKGWRNSPKAEKWSGALFSARSRAPLLGGNFAVWGGTFSCFDCSFQHLRGKEDYWNAIASGFCTGGVLAFRGGWRSSLRNAVIGGVLLGIIEAVSMALSRRTTPTPRQQFEQLKEFEKQQQLQQQQQPQSKDGIGTTTAFGSPFPTFGLFSGGDSNRGSMSGGSSGNSGVSSQGDGGMFDGAAAAAAGSYSSNEWLPSTSPGERGGAAAVVGGNSFTSAFGLPISERLA